jgi:hypothetical protein
VLSTSVRGTSSFSRIWITCRLRLRSLSEIVKDRGRGIAITHCCNAKTRPQSHRAAHKMRMDMTALPVEFLDRLRELEGSYLRETDPVRQSGFGGGHERCLRREGNCL